MSKFEYGEIEMESNIFNKLLNISKLEEICKGRKGGVLVECKDNMIPIVRTTTQYKSSVKELSEKHKEIMEKIAEEFNNREEIQSNHKEKRKIYKPKEVIFNNALIEVYDSEYRKMGYHTDQSQDLELNSYICLYSCYENDSKSSEDIRKLKIKHKGYNDPTEFLLKNNSFILFTTQANQDHLHKIILESNTSKNRWLGITFRLSKTYINFINNIPYINTSNKILRLGNSEEIMELRRHKGKENKSSGYIYPELDYTISESDLMPIKEEV